MLIDQVTVKVKAGDGGNGKTSFIRNSQTSRGGPDGGNGGNGADVYFQGIDDITALSLFQYKKELKGDNGIAGGKSNKFGKNASPLIIYLPIGTLVKDQNENVVADITDNTTKILIAKGGHGGRGNNEFKSSTNQAPRYRELGEKGEEKVLLLELKLTADIGLVGLPNAGKSSLLKVLTNAHPKIGDYPFTTLEPNLGVIPTPDKNANHKVLADIPGIIEGASKGKGLGFSFLRHIEKTKLLLHCIDGTSSDPVSSYEVIRNEFSTYNPQLVEKKEIIVLTKTDLLEKTDVTKLISLLEKKLKKNVLAVSIYDDSSLTTLRNLILSS